MRSLHMRPRGVVVIEGGLPQSGCAAGGRLDALEHVANRPIAHHVLDVLESAGIEEIVVATSAELAGEVRACLAARDQDPRVRLNYVEGRGPIDLAAAVTLAAPLIGDAPCIVHLASGLLGEPLAPFADPLAGDAPDVVLIVHQRPAPNEHLSAATQAMLHLAELDPQRDALGTAGVWLFGPGALRQVSGASWRTDGEVDLTTVADRITAAGGSVRVRLIDAWRRYAGDPLDLLELNRITLDRLGNDMQRPSNNGNRIEGRVWIHERASVRASVIVGPAVIGPDASVLDAYIGPYTSVGAGARIEGAEIERSIISPGASIMHIGGRLATSVVGRDARVFRDFSRPRALRLQVGDAAEVALG